MTLLQEMSAPIAGPEEPLVIPSLFRYLAHDERLLQETWRSIAPVITEDSLSGRGRDDLPACIRSRSPNASPCPAS